MFYRVLNASLSLGGYHLKSVCIRSFSGPYFPAFGLNTEIYSVNLRIQPECRKTLTRKTLNTDTFHAMGYSRMGLPFATSFLTFYNHQTWLNDG